MASDGVGNVITNNGSTWSYPTSVDATRTSASVSCPTSTICADVDSSGYATTYAPAPAPSPTVSQLTWDTESPIVNILSDGAFDYIFGPAGTPVEAIALSTSTPTYLTFTPGAETWVATNEAGDLSSFYGYDAFGTLAFGTPATPFGFAGEYSDATTGFSNLRARFYDPQSASFTARDSAFAATDTAYTYAGDDPVNRSDPLGLCNTPGAVDYYPGACATTGPESIAAGQYIQSHVGNSGFNIINGLKADVDYAAGIANAAVSFATFGNVHVSGPYCGYGWASDIGGVYFNVSLGILGIGEAEGAEVGSVVDTEAGSFSSTSTDLVPYEDYPPDAISPRGFVGGSTPDTLHEGAVLSRYGGEGGKFVSPDGTPFSARGLPPGFEALGESRYVVAEGQSVDVLAGISSYWQGGGLGVQYELPDTIENLVNQGVLKEYQP